MINGKAAPNSLYGTPCYAPGVVKFNPVDKLTTHIGPDFGVRCWMAELLEVD